MMYFMSNILNFLLGTVYPKPGRGQQRVLTWRIPRFLQWFKLSPGMFTEFLPQAHRLQWISLGCAIWEAGNGSARCYGSHHPNISRELTIRYKIEGMASDLALWTPTPASLEKSKDFIAVKISSVGQNDLPTSIPRFFHRFLAIFLATQRGNQTWKILIDFDDLSIGPLKFHVNRLWFSRFPLRPPWVSPVFHGDFLLELEGFLPFFVGSQALQGPELISWFGGPSGVPRARPDVNPW